jgi:hypothetical protein
MTAEHRCPGGCGVMVARARLACPDCWPLLPAELRRRVIRGRGRDLAAISRALAWYRDHVRGGEPA